MHVTNPRRQPGQGGEADRSTRDLRAELEAAETAHYAKLKGAPVPGASPSDNTNGAEPSAAPKRPLALASRSGNDDGGQEGEEEDPEAKRRRILEESRDIDADDSDEAEDDDDDSSDDDSDDEEAELQRELERVRRERAEKREREERERQAAEQEARERDIALGNPLLNKPDFTMKRRWDDDVVFKNQARGTEEKGKRKEFINVGGFRLEGPNYGTNYSLGSASFRFPQEVHEQICPLSVASGGDTLGEVGFAVGMYYCTRIHKRQRLGQAISARGIIRYTLSPVRVPMQG